MGQAREIMDSVTRAVMAGDRDALRELYAADAVGVTPDVGRIVGRDAIADYLIEFRQAFPDMTFEMVAALETGDIAIDEAYLSATHTGALSTPDGEIAPTGKSVRLRECDVLVARDGRAVEHRFYFDQLELLTQLGLSDQQTIVLPDQGTRAKAGAKG